MGPEQDKDLQLHLRQRGPAQMGRDIRIRRRTADAEPSGGFDLVSRGLLQEERYRE